MSVYEIMFFLSVYEIMFFLISVRDRIFLVSARDHYYNGLVLCLITIRVCMFYKSHENTVYIVTIYKQNMINCLTAYHNYLCDVILMSRSKTILNMTQL